MRKALLFSAVSAGVIAQVSLAAATNFSFLGTLASDDQVLLFNFSVPTTSEVTLKTLSYAGGTNANGTVIPRGGFDPILALFDSTGARINQNDDGGSSVPADSVTGVHYDTFLQSNLAPGNYTVSVMEYNNFSAGSNLSDGFTRTGQGNFTAAFADCPDAQPAFNDVSGVPGCGRTNAWAFDILNVGSATQVGGGGNGGSTGVPEPASFALIGAALAGLGLIRRKRS